MKHRNAWLMWGLLLPTYFFAFFHRTSLSTIGDSLAQTWELREGIGAALGTINGVYFLIYAALQLPSGVIADTIGARITVSVGSAVMGCGGILFALAPTFGVAIAARILIGFGAAFNFIALLRQQVNWFDRRHFPLLTSLCLVTGNLGALFGVGPFAAIAGAIGWQRTYLNTSYITLAFAVAIAVFVRNNPRDVAEKHGGSLADGLKAVVANPTNYLTFAAFGLAAGVYLTFVGSWGVPFLRHVHGLSPTQASLCTTMMLLGVVFGGPATSLAVRWFGSPRKAYFATMSCATALWAAVIYLPLPVHSTPLLSGLFMLLGFSVAGFILPYTTVRESNPERVIGTALAFTNMGGFVAVAVLQVVVGVILDWFAPGASEGGMPVYPARAYHMALGLLLVLHIVSIVAYAFVREKVGDGVDLVT